MDSSDQLINTGYREQIPEEEMYDIDWSDLETACDNIDTYFPLASDPKTATAHLDNDPRFFCSSSLLFFQDGVKINVKKITNNIKKVIPPNIALHPNIGNKICTGNVEKTTPVEAIINIQELALC